MSTDEEVLRVSLSPEVMDGPVPAVPFPSCRIRATGSNANDHIIYPKWFYIRDRLGRYLASRAGQPGQDGNLVFRSGQPDPNCAFETKKAEYPKKGTVMLKSKLGTYYIALQTHRHPYYFALDFPEYYADEFDTIYARESIVYLRSITHGVASMCNLLTDAGSPLGRDFINEDSEMEILVAAVKTEIINVEYDIPDAQVREAPPVIALSTAVRNDSHGDVNQTLSYTYEKWAVGTWNNALGLELGGKLNFKAGVPFIASAEWEVAITGSYEHQWGGEEGVREVITSSTTVTVPPKKKARATIIVRNAEIDVGFTYTQRTVWLDGRSEDQIKTGVYNNVDSWHVDVVLDSWETM